MSEHRPLDSANANDRPLDGPETAPSEGCYRQETREIRRVAFILNPASAKGRARKTARIARKVLEQRGLEIVDFPSDTAAQARESARRAVADSTVDAIVVSGGDGILSLVLQ
ncbi:diacylglycerol kinase family protein, partial [uncultured Mobiluncus sp.]|uniref:diacylglycerol/lipid kinase family protein n=1 Tax=uncultured Mobiluncus sp. TaxID=293425 RepID=UPI0025D68763